MKKKRTKLDLISYMKSGEYALNQHAHIFKDKKFKKEKHKKKLIDSF